MRVRRGRGIGRNQLYVTMPEEDASFSDIEQPSSEASGDGLPYRGIEFRDRSPHDGCGCSSGFTAADRDPQGVSAAVRGSVGIARALAGIVAPAPAPAAEGGLCSQPLRLLRGRDQPGQFPARVEHAGLDRSLGDTDDLRDLLDGLAVIIDEVDNLAVLGRQPAQGQP